MDDADQNEDNDDKNNEDSWQTKAELEAIEAEINAESLVLTKPKSSRDPPSSLVLPLLPYQKEFLSWAIEQETGPVRGGILAGARSMICVHMCACAHDISSVQPLRPMLSPTSIRMHI